MRLIMQLWRTLVLSGVLSSSAFAAVLVEGEFKFPKLELKDGRTYTDVVVRRYDVVSERVTLFAGKTIVVVPATVMPDNAMAPLLERAPKLTDEEMAAERKKVAEDKASTEALIRADARTQQLDARDDARAAQQESRKLNVKRAEESTARATQEQADLETFAQAYVNRYFGYNTQPGADPSISLKGECDLSDAEPVPGWTGRWRFTGTAFNRYYHSQGGVSTRTRDFELLIQTKPGKKPEVVELRLK